MKSLRFAGAAVASALLLLAFQNCGGFQTVQGIISESEPKALGPDPSWDGQSKSLFPSIGFVLPNGTGHYDTVPSTLDLAERADEFIQGQVRTSNALTAAGLAMPTPMNLYNVPAHAIFGELMEGERPIREPFCQTTPCLWPDHGDWGLELIAMAKARRMASVDRDDALGTATGHYKMLLNLFDPQAQAEIKAILGGSSLIPGVLPPNRTIPGYENETGQQSPITMSTFAMGVLTTYLEEDSNNAILKSAVKKFFDLHIKHLNYGFTGGSYFHYFFNMPLLTDYRPPFDLATATYATSIQGFVPVYPVQIQGTAAYYFLEVYKRTGNRQALEAARQLLYFLRYWSQPYPGAGGRALLPADGVFKDHMYSELQAVLALIADAEIRIAEGDTSPTGVAAEQLIIADKIYNYIKAVTKAGLVGSFGETGTLGETIRVGIKLTNLGVGNYLDEVEFWTRNMLAESQIRAGDTGSSGMFWSNATHVFAIPMNSFNFRYNVDGSANAILAMHDVWDHTVQIKGSTALVNFLLNRASRYVTVRSELPYGGRVEAQTANDIGALKSLAIRVPTWADRAQVTLTARNSGGAEVMLKLNSDWSWAGTYAYISNIKSDTVYTLNFPIKVYQAPVYELRTANQLWFESTMPNYTSPENLSSYTGTFRGYDLVSVSPLPSYVSNGVPRFQRRFLADLPATNQPAPRRQVSRFVHSTAH